MASRYQATFRIPAKDEDSFSDNLLESGAESISIAPANPGTEVYVHAIMTDICSPGDNLAGAISVTRLEEDDWRHKWLQHYEGFEVNEEIYIHPVTSPAPVEKEYRYLLHLDPRDAFGDGRHPTTILCLTMLHEITASLPPETLREKSMLDIGTGTGILAVCASRMGTGEIHAIDCDATSVAMTGKNAELNGAHNITSSVSDIREFDPGRKFDIITANLLTGILQEHFDRILLLLKPSGALIISGISTRWGNEMDALFSKKNIYVRKKDTREGWLAYLLQPER